MPGQARHAGVKTIGALTALSVGLGVLGAATILPVAGVAGVAIGDAAKTFNALPIAHLGQVPSKSELLDSRGNVLATYYPRDIFRNPVTWSQIAPVMRNAIVAIEDARFWQHGAFDFRGTLRAFSSTLSGGGVQGGSDLAQQYVKNACILTAQTPTAQQACASDALSATGFARKIRELRIAANVEREMTRPQLLTAYLNTAYFDHQAWGIDVASQYYFSVKPSQLNLTQAALLAGLVENPTGYDPVSNPTIARQRRSQVLAAMAAHGYISQATANRANAQPLGLHLSSVPEQTGCTSPSVAKAAFFCDYVLAVMRHDPAYAKAYAELQTVGGLRIYTTLNERDQSAADGAVNFVAPHNSNYYNPGHNVAAEVMIQPGTGYVRAIAINRPYGFGPGQDSVDYAVNAQYDGGVGVQTGSSSKIFTLVTALEHGVPFGFSIQAKNNMLAGASRDCRGHYVPPYPVADAAGSAENGNIPLYYGTTQSINAFYVALEARVGLCNVVKTAVSMGMTRADGNSLLRGDGKPGSPGYQYPADDLPSFTLGSVYVSPMSMAAAYATVAGGGVYCHPIAITRITDLAGHDLPVESAGCHRAFSPGVAAAASYVLSGVLRNGTAAGRGIGRPAAAKTGTANGGFYAAFAGYTPTLAGYVSVFNPTDPTSTGAMIGYRADYREFPGGYLNAPGQMYGDNAPGAVWEYSFTHADLGPALNFPQPPAIYFSLGSGAAPPAPKKHGHGHGGGNGGGGTGGGGNGGGGNGGGGTGGGGTGH